VESPAESPGASVPKLSLGSWAFSFEPFASAPWSFDRLIADSRLGISGYAPDLTPVPPAQVAAGDYLKVIDQTLAFCDRLGIGTLRVDSVSPPEPLAAAVYEQRFAHLANVWHAAAERCARYDVRLVWEFEPGFWLNRPSEVARMAAAVDHPNFGILFDSSHAYTGAVAGARQGAGPELLAGGPVEYAQLLLPYIAHLHLIDSDGSLHDGTTSAHLPFGDGRIDFLALLTALGPARGRLPWWCLDFCFCPTTEQDARLAVPFVRELARHPAEEPAS
jgi:sugar phosphate isomerase/epimerase